MKLFYTYDRAWHGDREGNLAGDYFYIEQDNKDNFIIFNLLRLFEDFIGTDHRGFFLSLKSLKQKALTPLNILISYPKERDLFRGSKDSIDSRYYNSFTYQRTGYTSLGHLYEILYISDFLTETQINTYLRSTSTEIEISPERFLTCSSAKLRSFVATFYER